MRLAGLATLCISLHESLQEHYEGLAKYADDCAEPLLATGASSDGRATTLLQTSGVPEFPGGFIDDAQVIRWFTVAYKDVDEKVRGGDQGDGGKRSDYFEPPAGN